MPKNKIRTNIELSDENSSNTLIFCHGLGDSPSSWIYLAKEVRKKIDNLRVILPSAPINKVSINNNSEMPSWFDILEMPIKITSPNNDVGVSDSVSKIHNIIDCEIEKGIPAKNIILGGFSQGATLSLIAGLKYKKAEIGGILMLSGWEHKSLELEKFKNVKIPIFICHGDNDKVVLYENSFNLVNTFKKNKFNNFAFKTYIGMGHNSSTKEMYDVISWIFNIVK